MDHVLENKFLNKEGAYKQAMQEEESKLVVDTYEDKEGEEA